MRKKIFTLMLGVAICGTSPVFAMEAEEFDIRAITPIKSGMDSDQRREAIQSFLKESLKPEYEFKKNEICKQEERQFGQKTLTAYTLNDESVWIKGDGGLERFLGCRYLKEAIKHFGLKTLCVAETRIYHKNPSGDLSISILPNGKNNLKNIPVIDSHDFFSLSRYVGDERISSSLFSSDLTEEEAKELLILGRKIGFTDMTCYANLRRKDGKIYIIDTEYISFSNSFEPYFDGSGDLTFTFPR